MTYERQQDSSQQWNRNGASLKAKPKNLTAVPNSFITKLWTKEAQGMKSICQIFNAALSDIRTDFLAIPQDGANQNYVGK